MLFGCGSSDEEMRKLAIEEFERKVKILKSEQRQLCFKSALIIAEQKADSIIFERRINPLRDSLYRPRIPEKPAFVPTDSAVVNSKQTVNPILSNKE